MSGLEGAGGPMDTHNDENSAMLSLEAWEIAGRPVQVSVCISTEDELAAHYGELKLLPRIVIKFLAFTDGRGFSLGRKLREHGFKGELVAAGSLLVDQWSFLQRCGFTTLEDAEGHRLASTPPGFSEAYQSDFQQPLPLFRRRSLASTGKESQSTQS
jgi:uncharacterized protein (DUF934 family)